MRDIFERAKRHGIKFENEATLQEIAELSELLEDARNWRDYRESECEDTKLEEEVIRSIAAKIQSLREALI
jgi:oligoendopeptidase F